MTAYDKLYDEAVDNYGIVTAATAGNHSVSNMALVMLARRGRLVRLGHGVYRLARYVPTEHDDYALAVALVGDGAYLHGESVLALLELTSTNPTRLYVAMDGRTRKTLPDDIVLEPSPRGYEPVRFFGIPCQRVDDAIRSAASTVPRDRLVEATKEAYRKGFLPRKESVALERELKGER